MEDPRALLLARIVEEAAASGLADRSLRQLATAIGSSHRMLIYHFGSRAGMVSAIVEATESAQRDLLLQLADEVEDPTDLVRLLWQTVSSAEMLPFVRLFFECVAITGGEGLTEPWVELSSDIANRLGVDTNDDELRLGVAATRGLLIEVLATGDAEAATRSLERLLEMWSA